ncbi:MAG: efflux RND transporter permease subunit [Myxococcales bacterium]|nr:efflux RND transporter permease subunit [Myxococcales bacterium]MCB9580885.1 efflux RND transporter permease subunit [Polyangiaceae bacterium]
MSISEPFIRRPVATTLVMIALLVFGALAYVRLPVSALPDVDFPTILVSASLPGASAETMASSVATPLEREFSTIDGLDSMSSSSSLGSTQVTLQFDLERDLDSAAQDVQAAISRASGRLPRDMPSPPSYRKVNPAEQPILYLALSSTVLPLYTVNEFAETRMAQKISTIRGVAQVSVYGSQKYAVRIQLDPDTLASRGVGIDEVEKAIQSANVNLPTGTLYTKDRAFSIRADGQLTSAEAYRPIVVVYRNGSPVTLDQLGTVKDSVENDKTAAWNVDRRAVVLAIQKQPGANTVDVSRRIKELVPNFRRELPASVNLEVLFDRSETVKESVADVQFTLLLTLVLVVLVIFLFLRRLSATLIPSLAMPLAVVGTFSVMYLAGYTLDNLSLMALTLSVGFVVDDAIVMLENVVRHMEMGKPPLQAALDGAREIGFTILSMTISLVAVFVPILFMGGIIGRLFAEFSVTIAAAILISGFVSLTLTPMLSARLLRPHGEKPPGRAYQAVERGFELALSIYDRTLSVVLRHKRSTMVLTLGVLVATVMLFRTIPKGFLPTEDNGQIFALTEAVEGISFEAAKERQQQIAAIVKEDPAVDSFMSNVGARGSIGASNQGFLFARLKPRSERAPVEEVIARLRKQTAHVPGMKVFMQVPPPIRIGGRLTKSEYQLSLQSTEPRELYEYGPKLAKAMEDIPGVRDVTTDIQLKNPELRVNVDRDRAASLGISVQQIEDALYSAYGNRQVSTIFAPDNTYAVILELDPAAQHRPEALQKLYIRSSQGRLVPIGAVAKLDRGVGPLSVTHDGQLPAVTVSFNLAPGYGLSTVVDKVEDTARHMMPASITTRFQGTAEAFQSSLSGLGMLLIVSIFVIYLVLGILYESWIHPLTILSALPFAGFGALATLMLFGIDLNVYAFVGVILLVGLVKKNGIMMVDFAIEAQKDATKSAAQAIHEASVVRFRPIMMTTMAALFGTLPIALGIGAGAESRQPLGLAVVGGLLFSQLLTLYVTPVVFVYMDQFQGFLRRHLRRKEPLAAHAAE